MQEAAEASQRDRVDSGPAETRGIHCVTEAESIRIRRALQRHMTNEAGIVRTFAGLRQARDEIDTLLADYAALPAAPFSSHPLETHNLLVAARFLVDGAIRRDRNVGLHYNADLVTEPVPNSGGLSVNAEVASSNLEA